MKTLHPTCYPTCPETLSEEQRAQYWRDGFIVFEGALSPEEVKQARKDLTDMIVKNAFQPGIVYQAHQEGANGVYKGATFKREGSRFGFQLEPGFEASPDRMDEIEPAVRKFMWFEDETELFQKIYTTHARIQGVARSILGDDPILYQTMGLIKPAFHGSEKAWHQDNAYFSVEDLDGILGTWIALDDVTVDNGAMHFLRGGHKAGPLKHHHTTDCEIEKDRYSDEKKEAVLIKAGGIIFFHGNAPHFTPPNRSPKRRRALQYHYRASTNQVIDKAEFNQVFKEADGTPASCAAAVPENF